VTYEEVQRIAMMQVRILLMVTRAVAEGKDPEQDAEAMANEVLSLAESACYDLDIPVTRPEPPEEPPQKREKRRWQPWDPGDVFLPAKEVFDLDGL
jgi:hypothetical protein